MDLDEPLSDDESQQLSGLTGRRAGSASQASGSGRAGSLGATLSGHHDAGAGDEDDLVDPDAVMHVAGGGQDEVAIVGDDDEQEMALAAAAASTSAGAGASAAAGRARTSRGAADDDSDEQEEGEEDEDDEDEEDEDDEDDDEENEDEDSEQDESLQDDAAVAADAGQASTGEKATLSAGAASESEKAVGIQSNAGADGVMASPAGNDASKQADGAGASTASTKLGDSSKALSEGRNIVDMGDYDEPQMSARPRERAEYEYAVDARLSRVSKYSHIVAPPRETTTYDIAQAYSLALPVPVHALAMPPCASHLYVGAGDGFVRRYALHAMLNRNASMGAYELGASVSAAKALAQNLTMKQGGHAPTSATGEWKLPLLVGYWENEMPAPLFLSSVDNARTHALSPPAPATNGIGGHMPPPPSTSAPRWGTKLLANSTPSPVWSLAVNRTEMWGLSGTSVRLDSRSACSDS